MSVLELRDVTVRYGGVVAVKAVNLDLPAGALVGLIGPNGAGKTTLIDAITGITDSTGSVRLHGSDISHLSAHRRARRGLARTWQSVELFSELRVSDNLRVTHERLSIGTLLADAVRPHRARLDSRVLDALDLVGIAHLADAMPSELPAGHQKLVGIARALAGDAKVVLMDEPAAGLDHAESDVLRDHLRRVVDGGITVLLVEHDMRLVFALCDTIAVLDRGSLIAQGSPDEIRSDPLVVAAYLGSSVAIGDPLGEP